MRSENLPISVLGTQSTEKMEILGILKIKKMAAFQ
jgi:hypothetical protein